MSPRISNWTRIMVSKKDVNCRRVNKEKHRHDLAQACFVNVPRLCLADGSVRLPVSVKKS